MTAALALIQDNQAAADYVGGILIDTYGQLKSRNKHIAQVANSNERSAENWTQRKVCPDVPRFLRIAMHTPELNAAVRWLMEHGSQSPQGQRVLAKMQRYIETMPEEGDRA